MLLRYVEVHISSQNECLPPTQCSFTPSMFFTYIMIIKIKTLLGACDLYQFNNHYPTSMLPFRYSCEIKRSLVCVWVLMFMVVERIEEK